MNSVTFGTKNSYSDWDLILRPKARPKPIPKYNYVSIPARSGDLDLTEALGEVQYNNLSFPLEFNVTDTINTWDTKLSEITNYLQGQKLKVTFSDDPNYYYYGRCQVNELSSDRNLGILSLNCNFEPYKYKQNETNDFYTYKGIALLDKDGNAVKLRKINDEVKDSIVYYNSKWNIYKKTEEVILNGTEGWYLSGAITDEETICFYTTISNLLSNSSIALVSHFQYVKLNVWNTYLSNGYCTISGKNIYFKMPKRVTNTVAAFKIWLSSNNVKLQYELETPTYVELSSGIQTMLTNLDTTYTIDGYSKQDGTPKPLDPMPIYSFGDLGVIMLVSDEITDKLVITNARKKVVPTINLNSTATLKYGNTSTTKSAGTYKLNDFVLKIGDNEIAVIGDGTINFNYQEASL